MNSTAEQLAQAFVDQRGFSAERSELLQALNEGCDQVLTATDGIHFFILCLVDAEQVASKRFECTRDTAKRVLAACSERHAGSVELVSLLIVEVRRSCDESDRRRLGEFSNRFFDTNVIHAFIVDSSTRQIVTATRWSWLAALGWRRFLKHAIA